MVQNKATTDTTAGKDVFLPVPMLFCLILLQNWRKKEIENLPCYWLVVCLFVGYETQRNRQSPQHSGRSSRKIWNKLTGILNNVSEMKTIQSKLKKTIQKPKTNEFSNIFRSKFIIELSLKNNVNRAALKTSIFNFLSCKCIRMIKKID